MFNHASRDIYTGQATDFSGPESSGVDHDIGLNISLIGNHSGDTSMLPGEGFYTYPFIKYNTPITRTPGQRLGQHGRINATI